MNILFVCKWNRFRSKIAKEFFKKYNKNKKYRVKSAGIVRGHLPLDKNEVIGARDLGVKLSGRPNGLTSELMRWQDTIVIVADDVPAILFADNKRYGKKTIVWKIKDNKHGGKEEIENIINQIDRKVRKFVRDLK